MRATLVWTALALGSAPMAWADVFVRDDIITTPTPARFSVCYNQGCERVDTLSLSAEQWRPVRRLFHPTPADPAAERRTIAAAIATLERTVGPLTGTDADQGGTVPGLFKGGQMDCIDESTNTTTYLRMLAAEGLLRWHKVADRATRYPSLLAWPHTTAVIRAPGGQSYAVDSWFGDNGQAPAIVPLDQWLQGWEPPGH